MLQLRLRPANGNAPASEPLRVLSFESEPLVLALFWAALAPGGFEPRRVARPAACCLYVKVSGCHLHPWRCRSDQTSLVLTAHSFLASGVVVLVCPTKGPRCQF